MKIKTPANTHTAMQKTISIQGVRLTARQIRNAPQTEAKGGHFIATTKAGDVHWMPWGDGEVHVFNVAAAYRPNAEFGRKIVFLA